MDGEKQNGGDHASGAEECLPCRGTGSVVSNLGGARSDVPCPWCEGSGRRLRDHDAQARFREGPKA